MDIVFPINNIEIILKCIPQRNPIVMVDTLISYSENVITAGLTINETSIFTNEKQLNESGLIEHMAQTVALHTGFSFFIKKEAAPTGYIGSISKLVIKKLPKAKEVLITTATILHDFAGITLVEIVSKINDEIIAEGQMKTVIAK